MIIALYRPEIPQNCGNIARTCSATGCELLLIPPLGFYMHDKFVKRSGMDYIKNTPIEVCKEDAKQWFLREKQRCWLFSAQADLRYDEVNYQENDILLFGSESCGLPEDWMIEAKQRTCKIPMVKGNRSLNLATSVGIVIYEAKRQQNFKF